MCDRNAKSEFILIKLCALVFFECICERITKFHEKIFDNRVNNRKIPMTIYLGFQYSVAYCSH